MLRLTRLIVLGLVAATAGACGEPLALDPADTASSLRAGAAQEPRILATIRAATARYHRVEVAQDAGYVQVSPCIASPAGGMGFHFRNAALVNGVVDPAKPEMLLYAPRPNGTLELVGLEFVVPKDLWSGAEPPTLGTQPFGEDPFGNWALHVWVWRHNPSGMYADFNPTVTC